MIILKIAAFWLPVIGIGGIVGAIETGTSPVIAVVAFLIGCVVMMQYIKLDKAVCWKDKEVKCFINHGICRKERRLNEIEFLKMRKEMCENSIKNCSDRIEICQEELKVVNTMLNKITGRQDNTTAQ